MKLTHQAVVATAAMVGAFLVMAPAERAFAQPAKGGKGKAPVIQTKQVPQIRDAKIGVLKVQGNIYMLVMPTKDNVVISVGDSGVLVVDPPPAGYGEAVIAEIRKLSSKPIRYILNTSIDKTPSNGIVSRAGTPVTGGNLGAVAFDNGATIIAHENVLLRMADVPEGQPVPDSDLLPTTTYNDGQKEVFFNEEPVVARFEEAAHTDGDSVVYFRRSDVIAAGDIFDMTLYPHIDLAKGGNVEGVIRALNYMLDFAIPKHNQEGGTYIIPGRGRLTDEHDLLEYRDMVTIIRDRVKAAVAKGQTLAQVKAAKPTYEYDARWGSNTGDWTTEKFIEAVYKSVGGK
jgi:glyoxylase-like metal-dependent hydrolase (beta-lactamase superfamily II)